MRHLEPVGDNSGNRRLFSGLESDDSSAQETVFEEYYEKLVAMVRTKISGRLARRIDASDVVMSAFRSFFFHARNRAFQIEERSQLWSLLVTITLNELRNQVRFHNADKRSLHNEQYDVRVPQKHVGPAPDPCDVAAVRDEIDSVISKMRSFHREIAERILAGQPGTEIALGTSCSLRTVRRVENMLRNCLEKRLKSQDE